MSMAGGAGRAIGSVVMVAGIASVFFFDWSDEPEVAPKPIRPLKTFVVESGLEPVARKFPGQVAANTGAILAFEVPGTLVELPVKNGDKVEKGELLARLDPRDFQNELDTANAELERAQAQYERMEKAAEKNAVSQQDVTDARAGRDTAQSLVNIKQKALDDTRLLAKFTGRVAATYVDNFENVIAKERILWLQEIENVDLVTFLPEAFIAPLRPEDPDLAKETNDLEFFATFDFFPGRQFEIRLKEFQTQADPKTQTYETTFTMPSPEDVTVLPGMTATVTIFQPMVSAAEAPTTFAVPIPAVGTDGVGQRFVWKLTSAGGGSDTYTNASGTYTVRRHDVEVGAIHGELILVTRGISPGDRIAAAGVHVLNEGERVRIFTTKSARSGS